MNDPIGAFEKLRESLVLYIQTAFGTQFPGLERERERLLRKPGVISQEPWIEPLPRYVTSGKRIHDLTEIDVPSLSPQQLVHFKELAASGLVGEYPLHKHQLAMLATALAGRHCVVTAGTGSGKTESFLLPLFAYLVRESAAWPGQASGPRIGVTGGRMINGATNAIRLSESNAACAGPFVYHSEVTKLALPQFVDWFSTR